MANEASREGADGRRRSCAEREACGRTGRAARREKFQKGHVNVGSGGRFSDVRVLELKPYLGVTAGIGGAGTVEIARDGRREHRRERREDVVDAAAVRDEPDDQKI